MKVIQAKSKPIRPDANHPDPASAWKRRTTPRAQVRAPTVYSTVLRHGWSVLMSKLRVGPTTNRSVRQAPERLRKSGGARKGGAIRRREATATPVHDRPARRQAGLPVHTTRAHSGKPPDQERPTQLPP